MYFPSSCGKALGLVVAIYFDERPLGLLLCLQGTVFLSIPSIQWLLAGGSWHHIRLGLRFASLILVASYRLSSGIQEHMAAGDPKGSSTFSIQNE